MTAETPHGRYELRADYHQTPEDKLIECNILADSLDELIATPVSIGSDIQSTACVDDTGAYINRSFRYIEGDYTGGWSWPLVEKSIDISYQRDPLDHASESYFVRVDTIVHQQHVTEGSIFTTYEIKFYGKDRSSAVSTIETPNLLDQDPSDYVTRESTPYDHEQLHNELIEFDKLLRADEQEKTTLARLQ